MTAISKIRTDEIDNDAMNRRDALLMLTTMSDYGASQKMMLEELTFNFGYTKKQADNVYSEWRKQVA